MTRSTSSDRQAREARLSAELATHAHEQFPDNTHNTWEVIGFAHPNSETCVVEAKADPDDVGYPSFKFWFHFDQQRDTVECVGNYCFEDGGYSLLSCDRKWAKRLPRQL